MMHEKARQRHIERIRKASAAERDYWLDRFADSLLRATEWDADRWGFGPLWMYKERQALRARGGVDWPREVI